MFKLFSNHRKLYNLKQRILQVQIFPYYPILTRMVFSVFDLPIKDDTTNRCGKYKSLTQPTTEIFNTI
jgi:hypothetical protein